MGRLLPPPRRLTRVWALVLGIPFLAGLALLTLTPSRVEDSVPNLLDLVLTGVHRIGWTALTFDRLEVLANIAVFVPIGILAFVLLPRRIWPLSLLIGPALSVAIEATQRFVLLDRAATVQDVIANSTGATFGVALAILCTLLLAPRSPGLRPPRLEAS
ncbi:VanZ family protein [Microbacterium sp. p3-SID336]|uniref:VanZ family protein n=1 Tax=Microbacterium sp. p3-SID336 TaxID=2916212 RepID=UPI0021A2BF9A|nr:VanZ family protein [Microbacterium sp. p3-SID336]MCT1477643.1 VanZ family protein [Microbacterium sp. p3-SID336]